VPHVYSIINQAAFSPDAVKIMGQVFDEAWDAIEPDYREQRAVEIELARLALAKAVVLFASLGNTDPEVLRSKAMRILRMPSTAGDIAMDRP
jgi:hypothetical protein